MAVHDDASAALADEPGGPETEVKADAKRERFLRHVNRRTEKALRALEQLTRLGNRASYRFTEYEANQILDAVAHATRALEAKFFPEKAVPRPAFELAPQDGEL